ncbi:hypothetical protein TRFO_27471 [Tritrichomonas foetus]|uniref:Leucine Rich Repeat family protein n=1 Tax=Tritrichomonas foetus TaxID=1144522 RepID=A0A1J4K105_9EUKA|nr:hypothetical protein TRFO_27471 [Tritrichomonas foetus]|eukprot:OHT04915.1 hypothetical protein TRFO_27471 [Tritrichomonas foetus]
MERFYRIVPLLQRNDPIINSLNMCSINLNEEMTDLLIDALNQNTFIAKIVLHGNHLSQESCNKIFNLLLTNPKLDHLEIIENDVSDESIAYLSEVLLKLPETRTPINLSLRTNSFGLAGAESIAKALAANAPVVWLDLRYNPKISDKGVESIALSLATNKILNGLDLIKCGFGELGAAAISDVLLDNHTLKTLLLQDELNVNTVYLLTANFSDPFCSLQALYLWHCSLTANLLEILCNKIRGNNSLTTLALSYNKIDDNGGIYLADMILRNKSLVKLHLGANLFTPTAAGYFGVALSKNNTLQFLDLSRNFLKSYGIWPIAISLLNNKALKSIDLRYNKIDPSGAEILCELIANNTAITSMRLSGNVLDDFAIELIAKQLETNTTLKELELNSIAITSGGFVALCESLKKNSTLVKISLNANRITTKSVENFAALLRENTSLEVIGMSQCEINDEACHFIAEGIASNSTLVELDISRNNITIQGATELLDAIQGNYSLMKLDYNDNPFVDPENHVDIPNKIADFLERNNYYQHNILMKDMSSLADDPCFL